MSGNLDIKDTFIKSLLDWRKVHYSGNMKFAKPMNGPYLRDKKIYKTNERSANAGSRINSSRVNWTGQRFANPVSRVYPLD